MSKASQSPSHVDLRRSRHPPLCRSAQRSINLFSFLTGWSLTSSACQRETRSCNDVALTSECRDWVVSLLSKASQSQEDVLDIHPSANRPNALSFFPIADRLALSFLACQQIPRSCKAEALSSDWQACSARLFSKASQSPGNARAAAASRSRCRELVACRRGLVARMGISATRCSESQSLAAFAAMKC